MSEFRDKAFVPNDVSAYCVRSGFSTPSILYIYIYVNLFGCVCSAIGSWRTRAPASGDTWQYVCVRRASGQWQANLDLDGMRAEQNNTEHYERPVITRFDGFEWTTNKHAAKSEKTCKQQKLKISFSSFRFLLPVNRRLMTEMVITLAGDAHSFRLNI